MPVRKQNAIWAIWSVSWITVILFFVCKVDIMSCLINETPCGPYHTYDGIWALWVINRFGWAFWEINRFRWGHENEDMIMRTMTRLAPFIKRDIKVHPFSLSRLSLRAMWERSEKVTVYETEESAHSHAGNLISDF